MRHRTTWIAIFLTAVFAVGHLAAADDPADRAAVQRAIEQSIGWAFEKDFEAMFRLWADDLFHFWLFSDSQVIGLENFKKHAEQWRDPDFRGTRFEFRDLRIVFSRSGDVAWYSCHLDDCGSYKGKEFCLKDVFQTGVLEKRDGRWVHVLMHGSYPVDKVPEGYVRRFYRDLFEKPAATAAKPPGATPEVFAPGVVSRDGIQMKLTMSADGAGILYTERNPETNTVSFISRLRAGDAWGEPIALPYAREYMDIEPSLSPDGRKILFVSNRPAGGGGEPGRFPDIWMAEKTGDRWGEPVRPGPPVNTADPADIEAHPAFGPDGGIYFMRQNGKSRRLFQAERRGDGFDEPRPLPLPDDLFAGGFSGPCLSPDGRILLMHSRREGGFGNWDLYVAFRDESGGWSELMNLGPTVNTGQPESSPTFSPDGRFIFFTRDTDIYQVSVTIIDSLRPKQ
ncbi:MAG TPA: nuclear transport factor 2 family protein [Acidobacteriota bacterium]|nr:nuclear transport factor 2 family protein [Acidobacteriota bacterium]